MAVPIHPWPRLLTLPLLVLALLWLAAACAPQAQNPEAQAQLDVAGTSGGKSGGPLAKVGYDLALLFREYEAYLDETEGAVASDVVAFAPSNEALEVADGYVTVNATASGDGAGLLADLTALGLRNGAQAGPIVSGQLPILTLPDAAALVTLRAMTPAIAVTR